MSHDQRDQDSAYRAELFHSPLSEEVLFEFPPDDLSVEEAATVFLTLKHLKEAVIEKRLAELRLKLLNEAQKHGTKTPKGGHKLVTEGNTVIREKRTAKLPDDEKISTLLEERGVQKDKVFIPKTTYHLDMSRLTALVQTGALKQDDLAGCYPAPTFALKVLPSRGMKAILQDLEHAAYPHLEKTEVEIQEEHRRRRRAETQTGVQTGDRKEVANG